MSDSNSWEPLGTQFREVDPHRELRAEFEGSWRQTRVDGRTHSWISTMRIRRTWRIIGSSNETLRSTFERLARRAGAGIVLKPGSDLLQIWLDFLRHQSPSFENAHTCTVESGVVHVTGRIENVCEASANLCTEMKMALATLACCWNVQLSPPAVVVGLFSSAFIRAQAYLFPDYHDHDPLWEMADQAPETWAITDVKQSRGALLRAYKAATGISKDTPIYSARQHSMYKPQFYLWRGGILSAGSAVSVSFERVLREKKPPIRRSQRR
jgi:hypothetical protein